MQASAASRACARLAAFAAVAGLSPGPTGRLRAPHPLRPHTRISKSIASLNPQMFTGHPEDSGHREKGGRAVKMAPGVLPPPPVSGGLLWSVTRGTGPGCPCPNKRRRGRRGLGKDKRRHRQGQAEPRAHGIPPSAGLSVAWSCPRGLLADSHGHSTWHPLRPLEGEPSVATSLRGAA